MNRHQVFNLHDFEPLARRRLPRALFAYIAQGAEDGISLQGNRDSFRDVQLVPRMLVDVSRRHQQIELFGEIYDSPFGISPVGLGALYAHDGDVLLATEAQRANVPYVLSGASLTRLERVAQAAPRSWFQAYLPADRNEIARLLQRARNAGYQHLVITVDIPVSVNPDSYVRHGFASPLRPSFDLAWQGVSHPRWLLGDFLRTLVRFGMPHLENWRADRGNPVLSGKLNKDVLNRDNFTWGHIRIARDLWPGKLIVKGILRGDDAARCQSEGADGLVVSNHGGRQADGVVAPLSVLDEVVRAAPGLVVMMDGGVRRGSDVVKALALGARCVFAGRPFNLALAAGGALGVRHALSLLRDEMHRTMAHLGINRIDEIDASIVRRK